MSRSRYFYIILGNALLLNKCGDSEAEFGKNNKDLKRKSSLICMNLYKFICINTLTREKLVDW